MAELREEIQHGLRLRWRSSPSTRSLVRFRNYFIDGCEHLDAEIAKRRAAAAVASRRPSTWNK